MLHSAGTGPVPVLLIKSNEIMQQKAFLWLPSFGDWQGHFYHVFPWLDGSISFCVR